MHTVDTLRGSGGSPPGSRFAFACGTILPVADSGGTDFTLAAAERRAIVRAMREADGVKTVAAKLLGCGKSTLYRKLREHAIGLAEYMPAHALSPPTPPTVTSPHAAPVTLCDDAAG